MTPMITELSPLHHKMLLDHIVEGLTIGEVADKHVVSKASLYSLKRSDAWIIQAKSLISAIRDESLNSLSRLAKKSIKKIEGVLDSKEAKDSDVLKAADSVLSRVLVKESTGSGKIVLNMTAPAWHKKKDKENNENKNNENSGNKVQIVIEDRNY